MKYLFRYLFVALAFSACTDDFLETEPTEFISADKMAEMGPYNPEIFNGTIRGLYSLMYQTGTGGTNLNHDDFGQKGYDIYTDMLSGDLALAGYNYGWYSGIERMSDMIDYRNTTHYMPWRYYYRIIRAANGIIDGLGGNDAVLETDEEKSQMGQAKTMRAYSYFYLSYMFSKNLDMNASYIPLYISKADVNQPLAKASDVWARIKSDLEASVALLEGYDREALNGVNQDVARGLLAYTYLTLGEYEKAVTVADQVILNYSIIPKNLTYWNNSNKRNAYSYFDGQGADWIWGMDLTLDQGLDLVSWWGQMDYFSYSYAAAGDRKVMDLALFNSIRTDDSRRKQFHSGVRLPWNKFYHEDRAYMNQREITTDYLYMRVEEMHLIKAEALAFNNDDNGAREALKELLIERIDDLSYLDALTGDALKKEIHLQWRIEMWGEGKSYLALKRNKASVTTEGHIDRNGTYAYDQDGMYFLIPYQEFQDNPSLKQ